MPTQYQSLNVFISSAGDVGEERSIIEATIQKINNSCQESLDLYLNDISWEKKAPLTPNLSNEKIQDIINEDLENCHIFILILFKRWGSVELGQEVSNFEREINKVLELLDHGKRIMLLSYFRDFPLNPDPGYQEKKLLDLKKRLEEMGLWYRSYSNPEDFKEKVTHDLYQTILKYRYSTTKIKSLRKFWQLGTTDTNPDSKLIILFPPVDRSFIKHGDEESFWLKRLAPLMVFEDYKALQKIEKSLRMIGFRNFQVRSTNDLPSNLNERNRFWLCLPRNKKGLNKLQTYQNESKFYFLPRRANSEARIYWRQSLANSHYFEIRSPLSKYLYEQRKNNIQGEWSFQKSAIYAKDFAVLARFNDKSQKDVVACLFQ